MCIQYFYQVAQIKKHQVWSNENTLGMARAGIRVVSKKAGITKGTLGFDLGIEIKRITVLIIYHQFSAGL